MSATEEILRLCLSGGTRFKKHAILRKEIDAILAGVTDFAEMQAEHRAWMEEVLPDQTESEVIDHLRQEATEELCVGCDDLEIADVALLAMAVATKRGLDLASLMRGKLEIVKERRYQDDRSRHGYGRHITSDAEGRDE